MPADVLGSHVQQTEECKAFCFSSGDTLKRMRNKTGALEKLAFQRLCSHRQWKRQQRPSLWAVLHVMMDLHSASVSV